MRYKREFTVDKVRKKILKLALCTSRVDLLNFRNNCCLEITDIGKKFLNLSRKTDILKIHVIISRGLSTDCTLCY